MDDCSEIFAGSVLRTNATRMVAWSTIDSRANQSIMRNGIYASAIEYLYARRRDIALSSLGGRRSREPGKIH